MNPLTNCGKYRWIEDWITIPDSASGKESGRTHGISVLRSGEIVVFHQANPAVLFYSPEGKLINSWGDFPGAHGLTVVEEKGQEFFWLVDQEKPEVVKRTRSGEILLRLDPPPADLFPHGASYIPTWAAVSQRSLGGNGDIWVADGYGSSRIYRYHESGTYLGSIDGTEGAGRFSCPHGITFIQRHSEIAFYIADRGNKRFQVYDSNGQFKRSFGDSFLIAPDIGIPFGNHLLVPELSAGIAILDENDQISNSIGYNQGVDMREGWPNNRRNIEQGKFNSPHSAAVDSLGNIYVVEWITGGRVIKLERIT